MKKFLFLICFFMIPLTANATATAEIQNCNVKTYKDFLVRRYMSNGFRVVFPNDYSMTASKEIGSAGMKFLLKMMNGARTNDRIEAQVNYGFVQNGSNILVQLTIHFVSDAGTALQKIRNADASQEINELNQINSEFIGSLNNVK